MQESTTLVPQSSRILRLQNLLFYGGLLLGCFAYSFFDLFNTDFGYSIRMGQYLRNHSFQIPEDTIFLSHLEPRYTPDDKWFFHIVFSWIYDAFGINGLLLFRIFLVMTTFVFLYQTLRLHLTPYWSLFLCLVAIVGAQEQFMMRATLLSITFLAFHLFLFSRPIQRRDLFSFILTLWIWAQCHAYFFLGQLIFFGWTLTEIKWPKTFSRKQLLGFSLMVLLLPLLHPYGIGAYYFPWTVLQNLLGQSQYYQGTLSELISPFAHEDFPTFTQRLYLLYLVFCSGVLILRWKSFRERTFLFYSIEFLAFLGLSILVRKHIGIFVVVATVFLGYGLKPLLEQIRVSRSLRLFVGFVSGVFYLGYLYLPLSNTLYIQEQKQQRAQWGISQMIFPERAVDYLLKYQLPMPLFNPYEIGSYLIYRCFPETSIRPYILTDYGSGGIRLVDHYQKILRGQIALSELRRTEGIKTFLIKHSSANMKILLQQLLRSPEYLLVYIDETAILFVDRVWAEQQNYPIEIHLDPTDVPSSFFKKELPWKKFYVAGFYQTLYESSKSPENFKKARAFYFDCLKIFPDYPKAKLNWASLEASFGSKESVSEALFLIQELLTEYPQYQAPKQLLEQIRQALKMTLKQLQQSQSFDEPTLHAVRQHWNVKTLSELELFLKMKLGELQGRR